MRYLLPVATAIFLLAPGSARAHCDGVDGPVVQSARAALEQEDVRPALIWVQPKHEAEIREAFARTMAVRGLTPESRELADAYFFETLVRVHRAGEGAPYTGLQAAGRDLGPAIPAADQALAAGSTQAVLQLLADEAGRGVRRRFEGVVRASHFDQSDVQAGRSYVKAYVDFIHYVEGLYQAAAGASPDGAAEAKH